MTSNMINIKSSFGQSQVFSPFSGLVNTNPSLLIFNQLYVNFIVLQLQPHCNSD